MELAHIKIKDFRSFFGEHTFDIAAGVNYFVGPNNCGKSNLIRALELALDPDAEYVPEKDRPSKPIGVGAPTTTRITLTFRVGRTGPETTLLKRAREYELAVRKSRGSATNGSARTYADDQEVRVVTSFTGGRGDRQTTFQTKGQGAAQLASDSLELIYLEEQFRSVIRFAVVHSGEDLASLLEGKFQQILQLVLRDHLYYELKGAEEARATYLRTLQRQLLEPLRTEVQARVKAMFPEIGVAELVPDVPTVEETLSSVEVRLGDLVTTDLADKGTGVRAAVLVSMLRYLADQSRRSLVLAVEEPEAFLHPAGQEEVMAQLEQLAARPYVCVLVTTHSPYVISRQPEAQLTELRKKSDGETMNHETVSGDSERRGALLGGLFRDAGMAEVLERATTVPAGTRAVLITEGTTDEEYLRIACTAAGRLDLLKDIHVIPAGGATKAVVQALVMKTATSLPTVVLFDFDEMGRVARDRLKAFGWDKTQYVMMSDLHHCRSQHEVEIEDLIPARLTQKITRKLGEDSAIDGTKKCDDGWHYEFTSTWKDLAVDLLPGLMTAGDAQPLVELAEEINRRITKLDERNAKAAAYR